ncbi:hypothetical protein KL932_001965 [Ogataea haglerorum]|nr:hypothetical protein KL915_002861 [Ogataea haglerorum]KAG7707206.1 hypothetical protein KL950_002866 [Ogataea haglerorum]KAG7737357.1 hypothetical protein KL923_003746 [Ogataea haglerorum]KAG7743224.1 hypothetical protein KL932_001965 [Ogataea haglerorum]KAG7747287.1 hypothetical protein KL912_003311 [Ogataea haglerorum]
MAFSGAMRRTCPFVCVMSDSNGSSNSYSKPMQSITNGDVAFLALSSKSGSSLLINDNESLCMNHVGGFFPMKTSIPRLNGIQSIKNTLLTVDRDMLTQLAHSGTIGMRKRSSWWGTRLNTMIPDAIVRKEVDLMFFVVSGKARNISGPNIVG